MVYEEFSFYKGKENSLSGLNKNAIFPISFSLSLGSFFSSLGIFLKSGNPLLVFLSLSLVFLVSFSWSDSFFLDSCFDSKYMFDSLVMGMFFFLFSEALLFVSFFWAWFDHKWSVNMQAGNYYIPSGIMPILPLTFSIPLLNTVLLVVGGFWLSSFHSDILAKQESRGLYKILMTLLFSSFFLFFQYAEYCGSSFSISSSIYGSIFFLLTGFHGAHVTLSAFLIFFCLLFFIFLGTNQKNHPLFKFSAFYYHFVDLVWLFLVLLVYFSNLFNLK